MKKYKFRRQGEAKVRQEISDKRSPQEQLKKLDQLGYKAVKERVKLHKKIEAQKLAAEKKK
jgi:hypothetical protein